MNVSLELLDGPKSSGHKQSLARYFIFCMSRESFLWIAAKMKYPVFLPNRFDFMKSKLLFESFSDGSKSVNLVSHSLLAYDTRYSESNKATEGKRNAFACILQPSRTGTNRASLQLELHYRYCCSIFNPRLVMHDKRLLYLVSVYQIQPCYDCFWSLCLLDLPGIPHASLWC